ncbi:hypothetical protein RO3G_17047 [Rhizopus delemar RA 99-880]|uniref:Uncharacterized protein n=1 Tax=Rhizopus delemar (strain RA 99-880 / ATCC MYA-4621 / FGSC 9543 / NRRL 43880) TaxID=246409 RepID=I1CUW0_RHIO9|nr:hypothetical protein RO3G_17047 [Rhizopus delemar RA 99-880]|eukprot:EIE92240.1 hypothetical protein RO3G_17047 [Rhizopus delemar RA 99-880]
MLDYYTMIIFGAQHQVDLLNKILWSLITSKFIFSLLLFWEPNTIQKLGLKSKTLYNKPTL